jgi:hypothetical protein
LHLIKRFAENLKPLFVLIAIGIGGEGIGKWRARRPAIGSQKIRAFGLKGDEYASIKLVYSLFSLRLIVI